MIYSFLSCFPVTPVPQIGLWTFAPAFSPRFSPTLSPRSFFHTRQRFPISNHVTSGCMSPRSYLPHWSAVSLTGSSSGHVIALDQSEASILAIWAECTTLILQIEALRSRNKCTTMLLTWNPARVPMFS